MQDTKTNNICKDHNRYVPNGADCPLCHDAGAKTKLKMLIEHTLKNPEDFDNWLKEHPKP